MAGDLGAARRVTRCRDLSGGGAAADDGDAADADDAHQHTTRIGAQRHADPDLAPSSRHGEPHRSAKILVEVPVARLAAGEYLLTLQAELDKSPSAATAGCALLNRQESGVIYGAPK